MIVFRLTPHYYPVSQSSSIVSAVDMTQVPGATIKLSEMPREMENYAIFCAQEGLTKLNNEQELAGFVRKEFEGKFGPTWNCFVGRNFGSFVTHEEGNYIYFYVGQTGILLFKSS